jgi:hypothetical protein
MQYDEEVLENTYQKVTRIFGQENQPAGQNQKVQHIAWHELQVFVREKIAFLLDHDFAQLLRVMYRLDIDEEQFNQALTSSEPATAITLLVLTRELEKARSRIQYRKKYDETD